MVYGFCVTLKRNGLYKDFKNPLYGKIPFKQNYKSEILSVSAAFKVSKKHPIVFPWNSDKMCNLVPSSNHSPATICTHTALASHLFTNVWQLTKLESWKFCISEFYLYFCDKLWSKNTTKNSSNMGCFLSRQDINDVHSDTFSVINVDDQVRYFYQSEFSKFTKLKKGFKAEF